MIRTNSSNIAQIEYWNTEAGETWAKFQEALDRQIETLGLAAMDTLKSEGGEHIIDIGCGCGQTSLDLGSRVGAAGSVVGVDISKPMLEVALRRLRLAPNLRVQTTRRPVGRSRAWTFRRSFFPLRRDVLQRPCGGVC